MAVVDGERMPRDQRVEAVAVGVRDRAGATARTVHSTRARERPLEARELVLQEAVVEARVVRDEHARRRGAAATSRAIGENVGARRTIASVMPVSAWISGGIGHLGIDQRAPLADPRRAAVAVARRRGRCRPR